MNKMLPSSQDPFERLLTSHRRLEERLGELDQALCRLETHPREARATLTEVLDFFDRAMARHEEDEERSLFPRLAAHAELSPTLQALTEQHREHERLQRELRKLTVDLGELTRARLQPIASALAEAYARHIAQEEAGLFPRARALLSATEQTAIAGEMAARRGGGGGGGGGGRGRGRA